MKVPKFPKTGMNSIRFWVFKVAGISESGAVETDDNGNWHQEIAPEVIEAPFIDAYVAQCEHLRAVARGCETPIVDALNGSDHLMLHSQRAQRTGGKRIQLSN